MEDLTIFYQFIGAMAALTTVVTGSAIFFLRKNTDRMESSNKEIFHAMKDSHSEIKQDVKQLTIHLDERIEKVYNRLDSTSTELKEFVGNEVAQLRSKDADQDIKIERTREKVHDVNEALLRFQIEVSEKYSKRGD